MVKEKRRTEEKYRDTDVRNVTSDLLLMTVFIEKFAKLN